MSKLAPLALLLTLGCSFVGQGEGEVSSDRLSVPECWFDRFDLAPDFFASVPFRDTQQIRVQRGSDLQEVSDGVAILVNDTPKIRQAIDDGGGSADVPVGLPPELLAEIVPGIPPTPEPPNVSLALYLQFSCHNQNVVLYALRGNITFNSLFSGDPNETSGAEKLTDAVMDVTVADPRNADPGTMDPMTLDIPDDQTSQLTGWFQFHFQRGQPGQPFP